MQQPGPVTRLRDLWAELATGIPAGVRLEGPSLLVAAHPDDETIGAGGLLARLTDPTVVHVTLGAPRDARLVPAPYQEDPAAYAQRRRDEALAALELAGVGPERVLALDYVDQEVVLGLAAVTRSVAALIAERRPRFVFTHPYEGGHPDHDGVAFAVQAAVELLAAEPAPLVIEWTSYFGHGRVWVTGTFLPAPVPIWERELGALEIDRKRAMLACYRSQADVLAAFGTSRERFRPAPAYDFAARPHPGPVLYESMGWPLSADRFCAQAASARVELGLARLGA